MDAWHEAMAARQRDWPDSMTTLSTHDTKRGEDVRARITVLAEEPGHWERALDELLRLAPVPDPAFGSLLWQAVLGAWTPDHLPDLPRAAARLRREGDARGRRPHHVDRARRGVRGRGARRGRRGLHLRASVREVLLGLAARIEEPAQANSLAAKLLALTMPGVPDVYQGSELWETSLVDPDNRRPVDFEHRAAVLAGTAEDDAATKLHVTCSALTLRRERPELFTTYTPVTATGTAAGHVVAYDRGGAITVVTRLPVGLAAAGGWGDTVLDLPDGQWHDVLTGLDTDGRLADLLGVHPVALLVRKD